MSKPLTLDGFNGRLYSSIVDPDSHARSLFAGEGPLRIEEGWIDAHTSHDTETFGAFDICLVDVIRCNVLIHDLALQDEVGVRVDPHPVELKAKVQMGLAFRRTSVANLPDSRSYLYPVASLDKRGTQVGIQTDVTVAVIDDYHESTVVSAYPILVWWCGNGPWLEQEAFADYSARTDSGDEVPGAVVTNVYASMEHTLTGTQWIVSPTEG